MTYILILVFSTMAYGGSISSPTVAEFRTKEACEFALKEASSLELWGTLNRARGVCVPKG